MSCCNYLMKGYICGWVVLSIVALSLVGCAPILSEDERSQKSVENALATLAGENDTGWSQPVERLRARLRVLPSDESGSPFCRVFIEFQNVGDVAGQIKIRFNPDKLTLKIADQNEQALPYAQEPYDGISPNWETISLPWSGMIRFQISFPGSGHMPSDRVMVDVGDSNVWVIPQDGLTYYLSGRLLIEPKESDPPNEYWSGTLDLPKAEIPRAAATH